MNRLLSILCLVMIALFGIKQSAFGESSSKDSAIHFSIHITPGNINAKVGESGKLILDDFQGIQLKGSFLEMTDNPYIELDSDGSWKALKSGETELTPVFTLSQETINEIEHKFPGKKIAIQEIQQVISITIDESVTDNFVVVPISITPLTISTKVSESGQLIANDFHDIPLKGTFSDIKDNPYIQLSSDGTWIALKTGETEIAPTFTLSQETMNELENKFPGKNITQPDMKQSIPISITNKSTTMSNDSKHNTSNNQSLPSAKEANHSKSIVFFGILIIILIVLFYGKIKNG